jgi:hypothetical protein
MLFDGTGFSSEGAVGYGMAREEHRPAQKFTPQIIASWTVFSGWLVLIHNTLPDGVQRCLRAGGY